MQLLQIGVVTQFLCRDSISVRFLLQQCFLYCQHFCRDQVLSLLNLISYCSFILILRHSLLVFLMLSVATQFLCRDGTFLYSANLVVATQFVMSRQDLFSLCWNLCHDIEKVYWDLVYQCSSYLCVTTLRSMSRHRNISSV